MSHVALAHETRDLDELLKGWGIDLLAREIRTETVAPGLHVLFGAGGNVAVSIGEQGVLMVDSQFPEMVPKIQEAIRELGGQGIDFAINTHWHFDHADGNPVIGSEGTWIAAHQNSRDMMLGKHDVDLVRTVYEQPPYLPEGLPVIAYDRRMRFYLNGQRIELLHFGAAHTTGDTAVIFRGSNAVHMGDVYNARYPFIDAGNGGSINGVIDFCKGVLAELKEDSIVIPGHGPVAKYADLVEYVAMLELVRDRISTLIDQGASLGDVIAAKPTAALDDKYGDPNILIDRAYASLLRD
jgi:glyoxylase-like metal-dependent hydrolase (beta-lactamase superfamily II)